MFKNISKMFSKLFHRAKKDEFSEEQLKKMKTYKEKKRKIPHGKGRGWNKHHDMISLHNRRKKRKVRNRIARKSRQINRKAA